MFQLNTFKMGATMDVAMNDVNRCCNRCQNTLGVKTTYTGLEEQETLMDMED